MHQGGGLGEVESVQIGVGGSGLTSVWVGAGWGGWWSCVWVGHDDNDDDMYIHGSIRPSRLTAVLILLITM